MHPVLESCTVNAEDFKGFKMTMPSCLAVNQCNSNDFINASRDVASGGLSEYHPFNGVAEGQVITAKTMQVRTVKDSDTKEDVLMVYMGLIANEDATATSLRPLVQWGGKDRVLLHNVYTSTISSIASTHVIIAISPYISTKLNFVDVSSNVNVINHFKANCFVGQVVTVLVTSMDVEKKRVLVSRTIIEKLVSGDSINSSLTKGLSINILNSSKDAVPSVNLLYTNPKKLFKVGSLVAGLVNVPGEDSKGQYGKVRVLNPPAVSVILPNGYYGRVCCTEIKDPVMPTEEDEIRNKDWNCMSSLMKKYNATTTDSWN